MLAEDGLPDAYAEAILKQMCSHPHRVPLEWASSEQANRLGAAFADPLIANLDCHIWDKQKLCANR